MLKEKEYGTDPNKPDTDNDGLIDGLEIQYGFSLTNPDTDGNGILDGKEIISVTKVYEGEQGSSKRPSTPCRRERRHEPVLLTRCDPGHAARLVSGRVGRSRPYSILGPCSGSARGPLLLS